MIQAVLEAKAEMDAISATLESLIDANGLGVVMAQMREICYNKANDIAVRGQDVALAKLWIAYGLRCNAVAQAVRG